MLEADGEGGQGEGGGGGYLPESVFSKLNFVGPLKGYYRGLSFLMFIGKGGFDARGWQF